MLMVPGIALASIDLNLKYGSRGGEVTELQEFLIDKGFLLGQSSGNFFSLTRRAVIAYQSSVGLPATGYVGPMTRTKINDDLSQSNAPSISAEITETGTTTSPTTARASSAATSVHVDFCKNIEGIQTYVPLGMLIDSGGSCFSNVINSNQGPNVVMAPISTTTNTNSAVSQTNEIRRGMMVSTIENYSHKITARGGFGVIGAFLLQAYGEDIKVKSITVVPAISNIAPSANGLTNVYIMYKGQQIGSSQNWTSGPLTFNLGYALIVTAGDNLENILQVVANIEGTGGELYTAGAVSVSLSTGSSNAQGQSTGNSYDVPSTDTAPSQGFVIQN